MHKKNGGLSNVEMELVEWPMKGKRVLSYYWRSLGIQTDRRKIMIRQRGRNVIESFSRNEQSLQDGGEARQN